MWANAQRDGRPDEYRWRRLLNAAKFSWRPLHARVHVCSTYTANILEHKTWTQSKFCTWQKSVTGLQPPN